jgi:hypothetical protein
VAEDAEHTTFVVEMIVHVVMDRVLHDLPSAI